MPRAKYFIAHLLTQEAYRYHRRLTKTLATRFNIVPLHEKVAPHITVKIPFEASATELAGVEHVLERFASKNIATPLTLRGFGRFGYRTIYINAQESRDAVTLVRNCITELHELPWIQQVPHEGNKLHASVARFLKPKQFRRIWRTLATEAPYFEEIFDSLAILKKMPDERVWHVHRQFTLASAEPIPSALMPSTITTIR